MKRSERGIFEINIAFALVALLLATYLVFWLAPEQPEPEHTQQVQESKQK